MKESKPTTCPLCGGELRFNVIKNPSTNTVIKHIFCPKGCYVKKETSIHENRTTSNN